MADHVPTAPSLQPDRLPDLLAALQRLAADLEGLLAGAKAIRDAAIAGDLEQLSQGCRWTEELGTALARHEEERAALVRAWATVPAEAQEPSLDTLADALPATEAAQLRAAGAKLAGLARALDSLQTGNAALLRTAAELAGSTARWMAGALDGPQTYGPTEGRGAQGRFLDWQV